MAAPAAVSAETLIVKWDPSPDPNVTAYRVFIGTAAGSYNETFDVPGAQTSFVYSRAVADTRYYVSVAAQVHSSVWGPRSVEISGKAGAAQQPDALPVALVAPAAAASSRGSALASDSAASASVYVIAAALRPVSAMAVSAAGVGLFVEGGRVVRVFRNPGQGLQAAPALALDDDVQVQDIALDRAFDRTGRAFLAVSRTGRDGAREVAIERHRLLGGSLGESLAVVPALDGPLSARTLLDVTQDGRVVVAQPGLVRAFDRTVPTPLGQGPAQPASLAWDETNQVVWLTGTGSGGATIIERLSVSGTTAEVIPLPAVLAGLEMATHAGSSGRVAVSGVSGSALVRFEPATRSFTMLPADLAAYGTPVLVTAPAGDDASWYVVLRADRPGGSTSDTVVRITAGSGATQPIH